MSLLNPLMLFGLALASVPIIIHFLNRNKFRVTTFGAMMFLQSSLKVKAQTLRLHQLILLALRVLFIVLLIIALSRPANLPLFEGGSDQPTTHVLIIDNSLSMRQGKDANQAFNLARKKALNIVNRMRPYDNMLVITAGKKPSLVVQSPVFDKLLLQKKLKNLKPGFGISNVPKALDYAFWQLENSTLPRHRIYLFTDGQKLNWHLKDKRTWQTYQKHRGKLKVQPVLYVYKIATDPSLKNAAPVAVFSRSPVLDCFRLSRFTVEVRNYDDAELKVELSIFMDDNLVKRSMETLKPGISSFNFDYEFQDGGSHYLRISLKGDDFEADNTLFHALNVMKKIPALLVHSEADGGGGNYVDMVLGVSGAQQNESLFALKNISVVDLDMLTLEQMNQYKMIILDNVYSFSDYVQFNLEQFAEQGGGLLFAPGPAAAAGAYNKLFKGGRGILPAQMLEMVSFTDEPFVPVFPPKKGAFILDIFSLKDEVILNDVKVREYWRVKAGQDSLVFALLAQDPFLVYKKYGKGASILWTCGLGAAWSNFPYTQDYLPLVQDLVTYLSGSIQPPLNLGIHDVLVYSAQRPIIGSTPTAEPKPRAIPKSSLTDPAGKVHELTLAENRRELQGKWEDTDMAGLYVIDTVGFGKRYFAVSQDSREGQFTRLSDTDEKGLSESHQMTFVDNDYRLKEAIKTETGMQEWWHKIFLAALLVLCLELLLSWRFSL